MKKHLIFIIIIIFSFSEIKAQIADFTATEVCFGNITTLINTSVSADSIISVLWDLNGNMIFDDASGDTINYLFSSPGNKNVGLKIITDSGFAKAVYHQVPVGYYPVVNFTFISSSTFFNRLSSGFNISFKLFVIKLFYLIKCRKTFSPGIINLKYFVQHSGLEQF